MRSAFLLCGMTDRESASSNLIPLIRRLQQSDEQKGCRRPHHPVHSSEGCDAMIGPNRFVGQIDSLTHTHQLGVTQPYYLLSRMPLVVPTLGERLALYAPALVTFWTL